MDIRISVQKKPPSITPKGRPKAISDCKWESFREDVRRIYIEEGQTLADTMMMIDERHHFKASPRKWKMKLKEWGYEKHLTVAEMKIIVAKIDKRKREEGKDTIVYHNDIQMPAEKIENFKRRKYVKESEPASPGAKTPGTVTYSTPPAYDKDLSNADLLDEISEQILELQVSPSDESLTANLKISDHLPHDPFRGLSNNVDDQASLKDCCFKKTSYANPFANKSPDDSSSVALAFLEAIEMEAQLRSEEGGDNIVVYQKLSHLAEHKRTESRFDIYVALCSLMVIGYKKWLGLKDRATLMAIEILADALKYAGNYSEATDLYQQVVEGYEHILTLATQGICRTNGRPRHVHSPLSNKGEPEYPRLSLTECMIVNYHTTELASGGTQSYDEVMELLSHLSSLYDKDASRKRPQWLEDHGWILDLYREKRYCKDKETYLFKVARSAMTIAMHYRARSPDIGRLLLPPVLARFKTLQPLPSAWSSWEIYFYGVYAYAFESDPLISGRYLILAFEKLLTRYGLDGLGDSLGQYISTKLLRLRADLEDGKADADVTIRQVKLDDMMISNLAGGTIRQVKLNDIKKVP